MDVRTELEQERAMGEGLDHSERADGGRDVRSSERDVSARTEGELTPLRRPTLEEASFLVVESGKIRFFIRPRVEVVTPISLEDVQRFSFTLAPRNRAAVRRISVGKKRMPDPRVRERQWAYVDRVDSSVEIVSDLGPKRYTTKTRGLRTQAGVIEVARGTYAIASHRDHAHLLYELDAEGDAISAALLRQLRIVPRASYIAAVFNPESKWRPSERHDPDVPLSEPALYEDGLMDRFGQRRFTPVEPVFLDHEGTELVLIGGGQSKGDRRESWARS